MLFALLYLLLRRLAHVSNLDKHRNATREKYPLTCAFSARPEGFEPPTLGLEVRRSIQLSYGRRMKCLSIGYPSEV